MIPRPNSRHLLRLMPNRLVMRHGPRDAATLYLTFDDGPHPQHTPPLLDLLARHGARATFFVIGNQVADHAALLQRIVAEGHRLGNHSFNHPRFADLDVDAQLAEIAQADDALAPWTGGVPAPFRPPRGEVSPRLLWHFARTRRRIAYWSCDSRDYGRGDPAPLVQRLRAYPLRGGDVILMHDDGGCALRMLEDLLPYWHARGFRFAALPAATI